MSIISAGGAVVGAGGPSQYQIERSLRFNSADSAYLNKTFASSGNRKTWTLSFWAKRAKLATIMAVFGTASDSPIYFTSSDYFHVVLISGTSVVQTTQVFRDVSAWYHIVLSVDTTQATSTNRVKLYVNGTQVTAFDAGYNNYPSQNADTTFNTGSVAHFIGSNTTGGSLPLDGYLTEFNFIDGSALDPTSFGEYNTDTGVWQPKAYTGSYGTNGFYLNFSDNSGTTSTTLGKDYSGNGNNWTPNNFSVTAGAGNDSLVDTPTNYGTDTGVGGEVRGNYATLNPLVKSVLFQNVTNLSNGNLNTTRNPVGGWAVGTIALPTSGKWYWEITVVSGTEGEISILNPDARANGEVSYPWNGTLRINGSSVTPISGWSNGDIIGIAADVTGNTITLYKNNISQYSASYTYLNNIYMPTAFDGGGRDYIFNFGQRPFAYTAPSGFKALCTQNLPEPTIVDGGEYFNTILYTGTGSSNARTGVGFQPDWVWIKGRSGATDHGLYDAVRGVQKQLESNSSGAETTETTGLTAFGSDGFTVGALAQLNTSSATYVAWNWKANGAGVSNTAGTISSTVSANTDSGFSIVTLTTQASGSATVGHGLGAIPSMLITKSRSSVGGWPVYHASIGNTAYLDLQLTIAQTSAGFWDNTTPTSSVISLGSGFAGGFSLICYCFAAIPGYSAFGSYTGNGSADGPFVYTGFRPSWVMIKQSSASGQSWQIQDSTRETFNDANRTVLFADLSNAEITDAFPLDFLSNGFKLRNSGSGNNASGATYIYAAFAENPFKYALAR